MRQLPDGIQFGTFNHLKLAVAGKVQHFDQIQHQMQWQAEPEQQSRHIFLHSPDQIAVSVIHRKIAAPASNGRTHMARNGPGNIQAAVTGQQIAEAEIDIFNVAEVIFIEATQLIEYITPV
jgi:hypothetical protein